MRHTITGAGREATGAGMVADEVDPTFGPKPLGHSTSAHVGGYGAYQTPAAAMPQARHDLGMQLQGGGTHAQGARRGGQP